MHGQSRKARVGSALLLAAALALGPSLFLPAAKADFREADKPPGLPGVTYAWWNTSWHFRVPVVIRPKMLEGLTQGPGQPPGWTDLTGMQNYLANVQIDFSGAVRQAGSATSAWPVDANGNLASFTFDTNSVRAVAYDFNTGKVLTQSGENGVLPDVFFPGVLDPAAGQSTQFNASSNAIGTVTILIPGTWAGDQKLVFVYFDIQQNGAKPTPSWTPQDQSILNSLGWERAATTLYGFLPYPNIAGDPVPNLGVLAPYDNTTVEIALYADGAGSPPTPVPSCDLPFPPKICVHGGQLLVNVPSHDPTLCATPCASNDVGAFGPSETPPTEKNRLYLQNPGYSTFFRVKATKPVFAYTYDDGTSTAQTASVWYPSVDGGFAGTNFKFMALGNTFLCSPQQNCDAPDTLSVVSLPQYPTTTFTMAGPSNGAATAFTQSVGPNTVSSVFPVLNYQEGSFFSITSDNPVLVLGMGYGDDFAAPGVTSEGGPVGGTSIDDQLMVPVSVSSSAVAWGPAQASMQTLQALSASSGGRPTPYVIPRDHSTVALTASGSTASWSTNAPSQGYQTQFEGRVWEVSASGAPVSATAGQNGLWEAGGTNGATHFRLVLPRSTFGPGPSGIVVPLYNETTVTIKDLAAGKSYGPYVVSQDDFITSVPGSQNLTPILNSNGEAPHPSSYEVDSDKPIAIEGVAEPNGMPTLTFLSGTLESPDYQLGTAQFFGCVIGFDQGSKVQSQTVVPGANVPFTFGVRNLGVGLGGVPSTDNITLFFSKQGEDWPVSVSRLTVPGLRSGTESTISVTVNVPTSAKTGQSLEVDLVAQSQCNPLITDTAIAHLLVKTKHSVSLSWASAVGASAKHDVTNMKSGVTQTFFVNATNTGSGNDSFQFFVQAPSADQLGFSQQLLNGTGADVSKNGTPPMQFRAGQSVPLSFVVRTPGTSDTLPPLDFLIQGVSTNDSSAVDQIDLTVYLNSKVNISLVAQDSELPVSPGHPAIFNLTVSNQGSETEVNLSRVVTLPGWGAGFEVNATLAGLAPYEITALGSAGSIDPPDHRVVKLVVSAPPGAAVDGLLAVKVTATAIGGVAGAASGTGGVNSTIVLAQVVDNYSYAIPAILPEEATPGQELTLPLAIRNTANGNYTASLVPFRMPPGWSLDGAVPSTPVPVLRGQVATGILARVHVGATAAPGTYSPQIGLLFTDLANKKQSLSSINVTVNIGDVRAVNVSVPTNLQMAAGGSLSVPLLIRNVGNHNVAMSLPLTVAMPRGWPAPSLANITVCSGLRNANCTTYRPGMYVVLAPGQNVTQNLTLTAPITASGPVPIGLVAQIDNGSATPVRTFAVNAIHRSLVLTGVDVLTSSFRVGSAAAFEIHFRYNSTLPAGQLELALYADGKQAANFTIDQVPPNSTRVIPLVWTVTPAKKLLFVLDPHGLIPGVENRNETAFTYDLGNRVSTVPVPAIGPSWVLAAMGAAAWVAAGRAGLSRGQGRRDRRRLR